jgi:hypothetical protein
VRLLRTLAAARPGYELFTGVFAMVFGLGLSVALLLGDSPTSQALLPLVFVVYGVVHITCLTDVGRPGAKEPDDDLN